MIDKKQRAILEFMQQGGRLTVSTCFYKFGTHDLRRVATRLNKKGYNVKSDPIPGVNYHEYYIPAEPMPVEVQGDGQYTMAGVK